MLVGSEFLYDERGPRFGEGVMRRVLVVIAVCACSSPGPRQASDVDPSTLDSEMVEDSGRVEDSGVAQDRGVLHDTSVVDDSSISEQSWEPNRDLPPCDPPLRVLPENPAIAPLGGLLLQPQGGTGAHVLVLAEGEEAELDPETGFFRTRSDVATRHVVILQDRMCSGRLEVEIGVTSGLVVRPATASLLPETAVNVEVAGHSGAYGCTLVDNQSGATIDGQCDYTAGPNEGVDTVRVADPNTGEWRDLTLTVDARASLKAWGSQLVLPLGAVYAIRTAGGSGLLDFDIADPEVLSVDGALITTAAPGSTVISITDRHVALTADLIVVVAAPLHAETPRAGSGLAEWPRPSAADFEVADLDGDGLPDVIIGLHGLGYRRG